MGLKARLNQFFNAPATNIGVGVTVGTNTYPQASDSYPMGYNNSPSGYYFYTNIINSNSTKGSVSLLYPVSRNSTSNVGDGFQINTNTYPYFVILCTANYGYAFSNWSASYPGGPVVSYSNPYNFYYNDTYYDATIYSNYY
jgi:hypothetical protein